MIKLTHLIYCSSATYDFDDEALADLLERARVHNLSINVTGMLLYESGSFFQIIEGPPETIETLFQQISADTRHSKVITIIHEPIVERSFSEWTMGYSRVSAKDIGELLGLNDFFTKGDSFNQLSPNRAKKLLHAFKTGSWHGRIQPTSTRNIRLENVQSNALEPVKRAQQLSWSFQPIINARSRETIAFEAMPSDLQGKLLSRYTIVKDKLSPPNFDSDYWVSAISLAKKLAINCDLTFSFQAKQVGNAHTTINLIVETANQLGFATSAIVLKVSQDNLIGEPDLFARMIQEFRGAGLKLAIDNFGAGRSSSNLLESYQPDYISLNDLLVSGIDSNGARQAIVRGINQTCQDLGIDVIVNHVTSFAEFEWFNHEGITLFQGDLIAKPDFECLPPPFIPNMDQGR